MSNLNSEQLRPDLGLEVAPDQVLSPKEQEAALVRFLGSEHCARVDVLGRKVFLYTNAGKQYVLLHRAVSYLGGSGQHPIFKKRVQLPAWYKEFCVSAKSHKLPYDIRFMGIYQGRVPAA